MITVTQQIEIVNNYIQKKLPKYIETIDKHTTLEKELIKKKIKSMQEQKSFNEDIQNIEKEISSIQPLVNIENNKFDFYNSIHLTSLSGRSIIPYVEMQIKHAEESLTFFKTENPILLELNKMKTELIDAEKNGQTLVIQRLKEHIDYYQYCLFTNNAVALWSDYLSELKELKHSINNA